MNGLWKEYKEQIRVDGIDNFINSYKDWAQEMLDTSNQGFVSEAGDVENWKGGINTELAQKSINDTIEYLTSLKEQ